MQSGLNTIESIEDAPYSAGMALTLQCGTVEPGESYNRQKTFHIDKAKVCAYKQTREKNGKRVRDEFAASIPASKRDRQAQRNTHTVLLLLLLLLSVLLCCGADMVVEVCGG